MNNPPRLHNSRYKEDIYKSKKQREKEAKSNKAVGIAGENTAIVEICAQMGRKPGKKDRRVNQGGEGGGLSRPDFIIDGLAGCFNENKVQARFEFTSFWEQLFENCPLFHIPYLTYRQALKAPLFIMLEVKNLNEFCMRFLVAAGYDVVPRE